MTVLDFQDYLYEMLKGNPKYTLKKAKLYFSRYYKDFLQYYKEVMLMAENVRRTREWSGFISNVEEYLVKLVEIEEGISKKVEETVGTFNRVISSFKEEHFNKDEQEYAKELTKRTLTIFAKYHQTIDDYIEKSTLYREIQAEDKVNFYDRVVSKMVYESGYQEEIEKEMKVLEIASNFFNNQQPQYYFDLAVKQIDDEIINNIGE